MAAASHQLRIKYGLGHEPDTSEIARWAGLVRQLISEGIERESAGEPAAMQLFTDFRIRHLRLKPTRSIRYCDRPIESERGLPRRL